VLPKETLIELTSANPLAQRADISTIWLCIAIVAVAILATWPFANLAYADDFAYAHVALNLARTGHLVYNGWEFAMLLPHACWGALFIHLFGFSFECLRFSTIPFALGAIALCYSLVRRAGLRTAEAFFVTLLIGLSPMFLPLAATYMTDIPCFFFTLASLYSLSRAAEAGADSRGYVWLILGAAAGFLGGTGRQVVWLVPLVVLPYLAWVRRHQVRFVTASVGTWILVAGGIAGTMAWFNHQLYVAEQPSVVHELMLAINRPLWEVNITARLALMLLFLILPAALPFALRASGSSLRGTRGRQTILVVLFIALFGTVFIHPSLASIPWINSTLNWEGINGSAPLAGRPVVLTKSVRAIVAIAVYATVCIFAVELLEIRRMARRAWDFMLDPPVDQVALPAMTLFSGVYLALLVLRGSEVDLFDRYLLPVMPCASTLLLLWFEADSPNVIRTRRRVMPLAWGVLVIMASYAILSTQDLWSLARARVIAVSRLETSGIPRTAIDAGVEYNGWTQLLTNGQMNDRWVKNPPGAYRPEFGTTPDVVPVYKLEYKPTAETAPTDFGSVPYYSFLPPFHKQVSIDRVLAR